MAVAAAGAAAAAAAAATAAASAPAPPLAHRVMVVGAKGAGKSMAVRYIVNALLGGGGAPRGVVLVDADVGQPEAGPPGVVGATVVTAPLLGGPPAHNRGRGGVWVGDVAARGDGRGVAAAVRRAVAAGLALATSGGGDGSGEAPPNGPGIPAVGVGGGDGSGRGGRVAGDATGPLSKRRRQPPSPPPPLPLVINTPGWVSSDGRAMLSSVFAVARPDVLVRLAPPSADEGVVTPDSLPLAAFQSPVPYAAYTFPPWGWRPAGPAVEDGAAAPPFGGGGGGGGTPGRPLRRPPPAVLPRALRELSLAAYFAACLASGVTYAAPLSALTLVTGGVPRRQAAGVLNGSVVGLGAAPPRGWAEGRTAAAHDGDDGGDGGNGGGGVGGDGDGGAPDSDDGNDDDTGGGGGCDGTAAAWDVVGLGVVRAVDAAAGTVYVATPVGDGAMATVRALVVAAGAVGLSAAMMTAVAEAAADRAAGGTGKWGGGGGGGGVGWSARDGTAAAPVDPPYLTRVQLIEEGGAGPMRSRRNLKR